MPGKKKKYNARFPPARIKKIMQSDDEVGKVAAPVPVIISRALELFSETLLLRAKKVTSQRGARTLTPSHLKFCIQSEKRFDFLKDLVSNVPELQGDMDNDGVSSGGGGNTPAELRGHGGHMAGVGRGRGSSSTPSSLTSSVNPVVRGTGKRRGRPPKAHGTPPTARTKRPVNKFMDDEFDCKEPLDAEDETFENAASSGFHSRLSSSQERMLLEPPDHSQRLHQPSPFQRSDSHFYSEVHSPSTPYTPTSPYQLQMKLGASDGGSNGHYQRSLGLPPPAPVYTPHTPPVFRLGQLPNIAPKQNWNMNNLNTTSSQSNAFSESSTVSSSVPPTTNGYHSESFKSETNGNFSLSPLPTTNSLAGQVLIQPAAGAGHQQELDEDYDC